MQFAGDAAADQIHTRRDAVPAAGRSAQNDLDTLEDLCSLIKDAIIDDPPLAMKEGGIIQGRLQRGGRYAQRTPSQTGKTGWLSWREEEREKTGIKNLKIKYNKVFGYYLEVTNSYKDLVPDYYTRKQTLANAERYHYTGTKRTGRYDTGGRGQAVCTGIRSITALSANNIAEEVERIQRTAKAMAALGRICIPCPRCGTE